MAKIKRVELLPEDNLARGTYIEHPGGKWVLVPYEKWERIFYRGEPMPDLQLDVVEAVDERRSIVDRIAEAEPEVFICSGVNTSEIGSGLFTQRVPPAQEVRLTTEPEKDQEELDEIVDKAVSRAARVRNSKSGRRRR